MSNSSNLDTTYNILQNFSNSEFPLINSDKYHAHRKEGEKSETLLEHILLVNKKFEDLSKVHHLDSILDNLIKSFVATNFDKKNEFEASQFIKKLFVNTIVFHDYGKINPNFQVYKMKNTFFKKEQNSVLKSHHSAFGAYFFLINYLDEFLQNQN